MHKKQIGDKPIKCLFAFPAALLPLDGLSELAAEFHRRTPTRHQVVLLKQAKLTHPEELHQHVPPMTKKRA